MNYVRKLGFEETPDYDFLRELFTKVLKTMGETEDGMFDWMLLHGGKGWEAGNHTSASVTPTPHREHRRDREHGGRRSRQVPDGTTPSQLVLSPTPAHVKSSRRPATGERNTSRDVGSALPLPPTSRRPSQRDVLGAGLTHPYATTPNTGYRTAPTTNAFDRPPNVLPAHMHGGSESFLYGQQAGKNGSGSREETTIAGTGQRDLGGQARGMGMFDREQMQRVGEQDEDGGHGRKGIWSALCCRT